MKKLVVYLLLVVACFIPVSITVLPATTPVQIDRVPVALTITEASARDWNCGWWEIEWFIRMCEQMEQAWDCYVHHDCGDDDPL